MRSEEMPEGFRNGRQTTQQILCAFNAERKS